MRLETNQNELDRVYDGLSREVARNAMDVWFSTSQDILAEADSEEDDSDLFPIMQSAQPPTWSDEEGAYEFTYTHLAAIFHEFGAEPHVIRARRAQFLAFEWPDAPEWVREQFEETFPLVFFKEVNHPGVPERRFVRGGREAALRYLRGTSAAGEPFGGAF